MDYRISQSQIAEIQQATDIVELINSYIPLKKAGANYRALCPFHEEKTASFSVNPAKQIFHCFGCHKGGNVFGFVMAFEKVTFPDAVKMLAERCGVKLYTPSPKDDATSEKRAEFLRINRLVANYYHRSLLESNNGLIAREYFARRGFTQAMISRFLLGFAPAGWENLISFARTKNIPTASLEELGLILPRKEKNGFYDRFRNRVMFPIFNPRDGVVGFGGRVLDDSEPVYLNSPESLVFDKGRSLYGLNFAKEAVEKTGKICLVEGYTDVIMAHQQGFEYVVATLGTALTTNHIKTIRRYVDKVIALYDADPAGDSASARSLDLFLTEETDLYVARLPEGLDPYDCLIKKDGAAIFQKSIDGAVELFQYRLNLISKKYNLNIIEHKAKAIDELLETIILLPSVIKRNLYIKQLSELVNLPEDVLRTRLKEKAKKPFTEQSKQSPAAPLASLPAQKQDVEAAAQIIEILLNRNDFIPIVKESVEMNDLPIELTRQIIQKIFQNFDEEGQVTIESLLNYVAEDPAMSAEIVRISQNPLIKDYDKCLREWLSFVDRRDKKMVKVPVLKQLRKEALLKGDQQKADELARKIQEHLEAFSKR